MKTTLFCIVACSTLAMSALPTQADDYIEFPAVTPGYPFQRSVLTGRYVVIPPYERAFPVRVYATPPQQPYYNVPPYAVIAPY